MVDNRGGPRHTLDKEKVTRYGVSTRNYGAECVEKYGDHSTGFKFELLLYKFKIENEKHGHCKLIL